MKRYIVAISEKRDLCGVEAFARHMAANLHQRGQVHLLNLNAKSLMQALETSDGLVLNFPIVAWKRRLVEPLLAALITKLKGKKLTIVLHEWKSLNWKRRIALWPVMRLADTILFSAPEIRREFRESRLSAPNYIRSAIIPIPPNIADSEIAENTPAALMIREQRDLGRTIIGQFGSIYPKKNCAELLSIAQALMAKGHDVAVVFIGSFIKAEDNVEADFYRRVHECGLAGRVIVTGYLSTNQEVLAAFNEVDVFCYRFADGLTSRRGSVLAAAASGRAVVTNAPKEANSLAHHGLFQSLIAQGNIVICPNDADIDTMADVVARAMNAGPPARHDFGAEIALLWRAVIEALDNAHVEPVGDLLVFPSGQSGLKQSFEHGGPRMLRRDVMISSREDR